MESAEFLTEPMPPILFSYQCYHTAKVLYMQQRFVDNAVKMLYVGV